MGAPLPRPVVDDVAARRRALLDAFVSKHKCAREEARYHLDLCSWDAEAAANDLRADRAFEAKSGQSKE